MPRANEPALMGICTIDFDGDACAMTMDFDGEAHNPHGPSAHLIKERMTPLWYLHPCVFESASKHTQYSVHRPLSHGTEIN